MSEPLDKTVVVAGATGNVGPFVVEALLERGASVVALSRSARKLERLREQLARGGVNTDRLREVVAAEGLDGAAGPPDAVIASVGDFVTVPSLLDATPADLKRALDGSVVAHLELARAFLPSLRARGGAYVLLQGPLAFEPRPQLGAHLVSIGTAAQHMLFRALAQELEGSAARVLELVIHAFIREGEAQPGSPLTGEEVGAFAAHLLGRADELHGRSITLRSPDQLAQLVERAERSAAA